MLLLSSAQRTALVRIRSPSKVEYLLLASLLHGTFQTTKQTGYRAVYKMCLTKNYNILGPWLEEESFEIIFCWDFFIVPKIYRSFIHLKINNLGIPLGMFEVNDINFI